MRRGPRPGPDRGSMTYRLSRKAEEDLIHIYVDGARLFGVAQAEKYFSALEKTFQLLAENPFIARQRAELDPPVRMHPHRPHLIVYALDESGDITILRIRHDREDWEHSP